MSSKETTPVIVSAARTPVGRFLGGLSPLPATGLGAIAIREAMARAAIEPGAVDEVIMGMVVQGGAGQAPARQAAIHGGVPDVVPALTINKVCGSGLKAVMLASQAIRAGDAQCVVAGGMESMSQAPFYVYGMRSGVKYGSQKLVDAVQHDGLWCSFGDNVMGSYAEYTAEKAGITREEQDQYAFESHQKAVAATEGGKFKEEIVPVEIAGRKGKVTVVDTDEGPRRDTDMAALGKLRPAFAADGVVTAGNASQMSDAAAATVVVSAEKAKQLGLSPIARLVSFAVAGVPPEIMAIGPVEAIPKALTRAGLKLDDMELIELNEAFATQALAVIKAAELDPDKVNVNGGAVALGHPLGCTGAKLSTQMLHELRRRNARYGIVTMCVGGGMGAAGVFERL